MECIHNKRLLFGNLERMKRGPGLASGKGLMLVIAWLEENQPVHRVK